jgi:hypothetical protein
MPTRMIRDGLLGSDAVNALSTPAEVLFFRLLLIVDDYGRQDARPAILRAKLFPLKLNAVSDADVSAWLDECRRAGLVRVYEVGGKPYLEIPKFNQRLRAKKSKFPEPDEPASDTGHRSGTCPTGDGHMSGSRPADDGHVAGTRRPESESESESESEKTPPESHPKPGERTTGSTDELATCSSKMPEGNTGKSMPTSPHAKAVAAWCESWAAKYGKKYSFADGRDGAAVKRMLAELGGDVDKFRLTVEHYLADSSPYLTQKQHPLALLLSQFNTHKPSDRPPAAAPLTPGSRGAVYDVLTPTIIGDSHA